ncbi:MAG: UvrD-helicase domain-containing protein [Thermoflexaceae bacterium]|nr:UvrD-helicase domain-containing protein [Thermoflexaceae bacterium]
MNIYDTLNDKQKEAAFHTEGPLLILAGAGSGKTRTIIHRMAYLIDEMGVNPYNIMAITFTNKAAAEMRERVDALVGYGSESIWVCTFHSTCVRILRRFIDRLGYGTNFTIYDTDDQKSVVKDVIKRMNLDPKMYKERTVLGAISSAKDELIGPDEMMIRAGGNYAERKMAEIYREYQNQLKKNNAVDFDDLICLTVELFQNNKDILEYYQERFKYIMVDEYQDTNTAQFKLISILASKYENLCVVGDDDQSIYKFRGANISNILDFEDTYPDAKVIKLEQNYRSMQNILSAANAVIKHNLGRKDKALWSDKGDGDKVKFTMYDNGIEEAEGVVNDIKNKVINEGYSYKDCAVLYRTNAQSRTLEERFVAANIPYRVYGGVNFYQRKEIKDILAYLKTIDNGQDDLAVKRIINVPKRGIGATTLARLDTYAMERDVNFFDALDMVDDVPGIGKAATKINSFVDFITVLRSKAETMKISALIREVIESSGYDKMIDDEAEDEDEIADRNANLDEFVSKAVTYEEGNDEPTLSGFLEEVALVADIDNLDESVNRVSLMTLHSAKGLEFPAVYITGMEDGLFPSYMTISSGNPEDIEEERRLCYVGITRAMKDLNLSCARQRMIRGETQYNPVSRFIREIPPLLLEKKEQGFLAGRGISRSMPASVTRTTNYGTAKPLGNPKTDKLEYEVGDTVKHIKFGNGKVLNIIEGGRDFEVTVDFENFGVKKMFASFAKLIKC